MRTTPPGATVRLDNEKVLQTPCTFEAVQPGNHTLAVGDVLVDKTYYTAGGAVAAVQVSPEEQTDVSQTMEPGTARLVIGDVPPSGDVTINGTVWKPGEDVPAGVLDIVIFVSRSGVRQAWKRTVTLSPRATGNWDKSYFIPSVPRAVVTPSFDWTAVEPFWKLPGTDRLGEQPGTALKEASLCRDDKFLYVRLTFADGTPLKSLTKSIVGTLIYELHCSLNGSQRLMMNISSNRQGSPVGQVVIWDDATKRGSTILQGLKFSVGDSTLQYSVPWSVVQKYLAAGPVEAGFAVDDSTGARWNSGYTSPLVQVNFVN